MNTDLTPEEKGLVEYSKKQLLNTTKSVTQMVV